MCKNEKQDVLILDLKKRILADSLGLVVVVFVQNFESSEKCKLQGHIQQTSKKLQKQRACYYYYWFHISFLLSSTPAIPQKVTLVQSKGQTKLKLFFQVDVASKERKKKFNFTTMRLVFVRFLEEIEDTKKTFRN